MSREYPDRPHVGIGVVVLRGDDVLLVRRGKPPRVGSWSLPGGGQELGETVLEAAHREVAEETGLTVEILGIVDVVDSITRDAEGRIQFHYTLVDMVAEWREGDACARDDASDVRWVPLDTVGDLELWSETVRIIRLGQAMRARRAH